MPYSENLKAALATTSECLTPEQLEALLDAPQAHPHVANCPRCQAELALLKSFETGSPLADEGGAVAWISAHLERRLDDIKNPAAASRRVSAEQKSLLARLFQLDGMRWAFPAAALAALAIASAFLLRSERAPELQAHLGDQPAVYRSQQLMTIGPAGGLESVPQDLRWQPLSGAGIYRVEVMEVDHSKLWSAETPGTSQDLPSSLRAKIVPGKSILWQVTALDVQGRVLATSQVQKFVLQSGHLSDSPAQ